MQNPYFLMDFRKIGDHIIAKQEDKCGAGIIGKGSKSNP